MPEIPTQPQPTSNPKSVNWKSIIIGVLIGSVLFGGGGFLVYNAYQPKKEEPAETKTTTTKTATPSAKTTPKSKEETPKDETADWKIYSDSVLKFSIKHPKDWTINTKTTPYYEVEIINYDPSESLGSGFSLPEDKGKVKLSITKDTKSDNVSLEDYVNSKESAMTTTVSKKEILVNNRKAIKRVWEQAGFGTHATTYIEKDFSTVYFITEFLHYQESLYDLLTSTFKFLD